MSGSSKLYRMWIMRRWKRLKTTQIIALVFVGIIILGAALLTLPAASRSGESCGFFSALFTSTSATCVTGLVLYDTWSQWSGFGQAVILCLIEIGGLGFMSAASLVVFMLRRKISLRQRMVMAQALSLNELEGVVRLQKWVLLGSLIIQCAGAMILFLRFLPEYGVQTAVAWGVFHAVSAFCNAGFDIFGSVAPGQSVIAFNNDPIVCITLMALIVIGGLGFFVWEEVATVHSFRRLSVYTRLVLLTTAVLILLGSGLFLIFEWDNPDTIGQMPVWQKILNAFFQSVTLRTAGFASIDQGMLTGAGRGLSVVLMIIGGSSGSTAGGMKTVTFVVLLLFIKSRIQGKRSVDVFKRSIPEDKVMDAMTIVSILMGLCVVGGLFISATSGVEFTESLYEATSALGTVGLTMGITTSLSIPAQLLLILFMYFGRVGVLTISLGFLMGDMAKQRYEYAQTNLLIG